MNKEEQMKNAICGLVNMICFPTIVELFLPAVGIVKKKRGTRGRASGGTKYVPTFTTITIPDRVEKNEIVFHSRGKMPRELLFVREESYYLRFDETDPYKKSFNRNTEQGKIDRNCVDLPSSISETSELIKSHYAKKTGSSSIPRVYFAICIPFFSFLASNVGVEDTVVEYVEEFVKGKLPFTIFVEYQENLNTDPQRIVCKLLKNKLLAADTDVYELDTDEIKGSVELSLVR